jgi:hypothetical protein
MQVSSAMRSITTNRSLSNVDSVEAKIRGLSKVLRCEFVVVLDANGKVIIAPNDPAGGLVGTSWDPGFVVSSTLATGKRYTRSGIIPHSELVRFNVTPYSGEQRSSLLLLVCNVAAAAAAAAAAAVLRH